jgi:cyclopropane-fatty-acyl-phospholipid synthase
LPYPAGILQGDALWREKDVAKRWRSVEMSERYLSRQNDIAVLAYRVSAERSDEPIYKALCTSTYLNDDGKWLRLAHQQTPPLNPGRAVSDQPSPPKFASIARPQAGTSFMFRDLAKLAVRRNFGKSDIALCVIFSDGSVFATSVASASETEVTVRFLHPRAERMFVLEGGVGFVEAFHQGLLCISDEEFEVLIDHCRGLYVGARSPFLVRLRRFFHEISVSNKDWGQARRNAAFHYGYPARFFELVLGSTYGYVEGYWRRGDETLDEAMRNRFDYMCRKLYLKPGMKVAEVGSGWGYMTNLMARDHHVEVDTFGIVDNQNRALASMASAWGVQDKVHLIEEDHRALAARPELYDRYVSLGVLEHAGRNCDAAWIDSIKTCLKPGGIGLLSVMTYNAPQETDFITQKYIFPGGHIPHIARVVDLLESRGLCIIDLENARRNTHAPRHHGSRTSRPTGTRFAPSIRPFSTSASGARGSST